MKPLLQALVIADHVYTDEVTKKKIVAGIFHNLWFRPTKQLVESEVREGKFKMEVPREGFSAGSPFCYLSMTEVMGRQPFELRYVDLDDYQVVFQLAFQVECNDPLETVELVLPLPPLPSGKPGTYALELLWDSQPLGSHRIRVNSRTTEGETHGD